MSDDLWATAREYDEQWPADTRNDAARLARLALAERARAQSEVEALHDQAQRHGLCLHSGLSVVECQAGVCDCFFVRAPLGDSDALAEVRAAERALVLDEVERLTAERDEARAEMVRYARQRDEYAAEKDGAWAEVQRLRRERDEFRAGSQGWQQRHDAARAEVADLTRRLAAVEALRADWADFDHDAVTCPRYDCGDCTMVNAIYDLNAALGDADTLAAHDERVRGCYGCSDNAVCSSCRGTDDDPEYREFRLRQQLAEVKAQERAAVLDEVERRIIARSRETAVRDTFGGDCLRILDDLRTQDGER